SGFRNLCISSNHRPIISRLRDSYKFVCNIKSFVIIKFQNDESNPIDQRTETTQFFPATIGSMDTAKRVFLSALIPFASSVFPEFGSFDDQEQKTIIMNFWFRFHPFEATYRADKAFPDHMDRDAGGYTTYICGDLADFFLSDCPDAVRVEDAKKLISKTSKVSFTKNREFIARLKPHHEEFLAVIGIMFWTLESRLVSEETIQLSDRYRHDILQELHVYYREELGMDDYAARLGELLTLVQIFEKFEVMKEFFELLRLLDVFSDDNLAYKLIKE
ncbi:hypothetical protein PENTCL1PPCAC_15586, partial [Pristionchus entomophagus]